MTINRLILPTTLALLVSQAAFAQTSETPSMRDRSMSESSATMSGKSTSVTPGARPSNSTNQLENGTASGKGSGPGAGSPNGN